MPDVTIIGAGPAGSAAALMLARRGWAVTLIEQHRFPRDKVCGECLSSLGVEVLERLGLREQLVAAGGVWLREAIIHCGDEQSATAVLPRPMLGISRHVLDVILLDAARNAGAVVRQPARCEALDVTSAGTLLRVRDTQQNTVETLTPSLVILADGKAALPGPSPVATDDMGIKSHWTGVDGPRNAIELFGCAGCYGGLAAIEGGRWNAAFSVPAERVRKHRGDLESLFRELMGENRALARRLVRATRVGPWLASPLPRFAVRKRWPAGVIPIGNAAAALEPIGGEGMGLALRSAELAVEAIEESPGKWDARTQQRLRRAFDHLWRMRRVACRTAAIVTSSVRLGNIVMQCARDHESWMQTAMSWMGKSRLQHDR